MVYKYLVRTEYQYSSAAFVLCCRLFNLCVNWHDLLAAKLGSSLHKHSTCTCNIDGIHGSDTFKLTRLMIYTLQFTYVNKTDLNALVCTNLRGGG